MNDSNNPSPQLDLPSRQDWGLKPEKKAGSGLIVVCVILLFSVIGLQTLQLISSPKNTVTQVPPESVNVGNEGLAGIKLYDLATRLQRNNLPGAAARVLEDHLNTLTKDEVDRRHKTLLTLGNLLFKAERYEESLVRYMQAEALKPASENQKHINRQVQLLMEKLGKFDELKYELSDRTGGPSGNEKAGEVLARIGLETITASELDNLISQRVNLQLASLGGLPEESRQAYKKQILQGFQDPQRRLQILQELVARRILYREGMERNLDKSKEVIKQLEELRENLIAQEVVKAKVSQIQLSENDIRLFYQANPTRYAEPASADVRLALLDSEEKAKTFLESVKTEADFSRLAKEQSLHLASKENGGALPSPVQPGQAIPGVGPNDALVQAIFQTQPQQKTAQPVPAGEHFAVTFVKAIHPPKQLSFEEVKDRVASDYSRQKEMEAQQSLLQDLFKKHSVNIHTEAFINTSKAEKESTTAPQSTSPVKTP